MSEGKVIVLQARKQDLIFTILGIQVRTTLCICTIKNSIPKIGGLDLLDELFASDCD